MIVVNLYAGPGAGKSTTAALLFAYLKLAGVNAELVREYAKDVVWEGREHLLEQQTYVFAKQAKRLADLDGKVDIAVTDSPLLLSVLYAPEATTLHALVAEEHARYENLDVYLRRVKPYHPEGRLQTEDEARDLDAAVVDVVARYAGGFDYEVSGDELGAETLLAAVRGYLATREG